MITPPWEARYSYFLAHAFPQSSFLLPGNGLLNTNLWFPNHGYPDVYVTQDEILVTVLPPDPFLLSPSLFHSSFPEWYTLVRDQRTKIRFLSTQKISQKWILEAMLNNLFWITRPLGSWVHYPKETDPHH